MDRAKASPRRKAATRDGPVSMDAETLAVHAHSKTNSYPLDRNSRSLESQQGPTSTSPPQCYQLPDRSIVTADNPLSTLTRVPLSPTSQVGSNGRELPRPKACAPCKNSHVVCGHVRPCARCSRQGRPHECVDPLPQKRGRPRNDPDRVGAPRDPNKPRHEPKRRRKADRAHDNNVHDIEPPIVPRRRPSKRAPKKLQEDVKPAVTTPVSTATQSPSVAHIDAFQPTNAAITPFSTFSPTPAEVLPNTPTSADSKNQSIAHRIARAVNWTEVNNMLFPGPEIPQASKPELPEACPLVLAVTECANPAASNAGDVPSRQPSSDLMNGLDQLDTVLDGLLAEFDEASQGGLTLPAHNFGDLSGFANSNVELEVTDITGAYLDEMFDANGDIIVTVDTGAVPEGNMNPAITETDILGEVLLSPCGSVSGTLESMLNESVAGINNGDGETNSVSNVDTTMTEAHTMERTRSLANEDYLFAHILGIAAAETQVTEANFSPGIAENEGPSMAIADLGIEFEGGAALPIAMSNLQVEFMQIEQQINL